MEKINAVLLAGGKSSRFGALDKALISFAEMTLIEYIYYNLKDNFDRVIIVGSKERYNFLKNAEIREDIYQNKGPLAGIYTGLYFSETNYNFICGCDMPFLTAEYFDFLKAQLSNKSAVEIIVPTYNGFLEPLAALYHSSLLNKIKSEILANNLKIKSIYTQTEKNIISEKILKNFFNLEKLFFNLNYPEDKKRAVKYLKEGEFESDDQIDK